jgi:hypothetical protein
MRGINLQRRFAFLAATSLAMAIAATAYAIPAYTGGNGGISFGVSSYGGAPNVGGPTFIPNNFTGLNDILSSPGLGTLGGYLTANPIVVNNISSTGAVPLPVAAFQFGGGNINGAFGSAAANNLGPTMGYTIADAGPGGGSASYLVDSGITSYTDAAGTPIGTAFGAYVTMGGVVPLVGNADVSSLKVTLSSANPASPFFGGVALPNMVLAISRNNATNTLADYNIVRIGGVAGANAGMIVDNTATGAFRAMAVDRMLLPAAIPAGDVITVKATITAYADPASFDTFDVAPLDLLALTGPLPDVSFVTPDSQPLPEPGALLLLSGAALLLQRRTRESE